jgi:hypothetical protein
VLKGAFGRRRAGSARWRRSDEARDHARGVFVALRELVGDDEFFDVVVELPWA